MYALARLTSPILSPATVIPLPPTLISWTKFHFHGLVCVLPQLPVFSTLFSPTWNNILSLSDVQTLAILLPELRNCFFWIFFWSFPGCSLIHLQSFVYLFAHVPTKALSPNPTSIPVPVFTLNQRIRIMTNSVEIWFILSSTTITRIDVVS